MTWDKPTPLSENWEKQNAPGLYVQWSAGLYLQWYDGLYMTWFEGAEETGIQDWAKQGSATGAWEKEAAL